MTGPRSKVELAAQLYAGIAAAAFVASGVLYLYTGYIPMTHQDFWQVYDTLLNHSWLEGALLKFNGHSLFFPTWFWLIDLHWFHGSQELLFFVGMILLSLSVVVMAWPIWRDETLGRTTKLAALLVLGVSNFWMGRSFMLVSGAFNICYSLAVGGAALAFLYLPAMREGLTKSLGPILVILGASVISTFSFGAGLVVWPTLLVLGWCLRLPWRSLVLLGAAMIISAVIYALLPPHVPHESFVDTKSLFASDLIVPIGQLCRLVGSPIHYTVQEWQTKTAPTGGTPAFMLAFWSGVAGLGLGAAATLPYLIRRNLFGKSLQRTGLFLAIFNLLALVMIVISRSQHFVDIPNEVIAPRYVFWSSLFWAGLILIALGITEKLKALRWICLLFVFALPILIWPEHMAEGFHWRYARIYAEEDAVSLINGVDDPQKNLFPDPAQVKRLTTELRERRLDFFAAGWQDWLGQPVATVFPGAPAKGKFRGSAEASPLPLNDKQSETVIVKGRLRGEAASLPAEMVIIDSKGIVAGIAVSPKISDLLNTLLFRGRAPRGIVNGYIPHYTPSESYLLRAVRGTSLSDKSIAIPTLAR